MSSLTTKKLLKQIQEAGINIPEFELKPNANYKPRISAEHLCLLWALKQVKNKPITTLIEEALDAYFESNKKVFKKGGEEK